MPLKDHQPLHEEAPRKQKEEGATGHRNWSGTYSGNVHQKWRERCGEWLGGVEGPERHYGARGQLNTRKKLQRLKGRMRGLRGINMEKKTEAVVSENGQMWKEIDELKSINLNVVFASNPPPQSTPYLASTAYLLPSEAYPPSATQEKETGRRCDKDFGSLQADFGVPRNIIVESSIGAPEWPFARHRYRARLANAAVRLCGLRA
ncbi:hypothetical protein B0H16DRAFT_1477480 [Mycena metata]|uniref:Uncharacterized protein n=1 Tax=Mycena metata TaxID=1033252 RepID=A0AAD7H8W6_9AGAR|nr:hypothetical protein B0H16DRAFT_1477480 [Mycena metata]